MVMSKTLAKKKKKPQTAQSLSGMRQMAAGEFKAKCLSVMNEVKKTGRPVVVTKRGRPVIEVYPAADSGKKKKDAFFGRLKGIIEIVGDPDDLIKPVFPLEDYDMLK